MNKSRMATAHGVEKFWKLGIEDFNTHYFDVGPDFTLFAKEGNYQYDILKLIKQYGTPAEIVFPHILEDRLDNLISLFNSYIKIYRYPSKFYYN